MYSIDSNEELLRRDPFQWFNANVIKKTTTIKDALPTEKVKPVPMMLDWHLAGISWSSEPCAMLSQANQIFVMRHGNELGNGWHIEKISEDRVICKHSSGEVKELKI